MKKSLFIIIAAGLVVLTAGCKHNKDYKALIEGRIGEFYDFLEETEKDTDLSIRQVEDAVDSAYGRMQSDVASLASEALSEHSDDSVAVYVVLQSRDLKITDDEGILKMIDNLGPNASADPAITELKGKLVRAEETAEGCRSLDFSIKQPDGSVKKLSDYAGKGKYCLVDFWASWCRPCLEEIPNLVEVYKKFSSKGLVMVSVAVFDNPVDSQRVIDDLGMKWNHILGAGGEVTDAYSIEGIPHILLLSPEGIILKRDLRGEEIAEAVGEYLK